MKKHPFHRVLALILAAVLVLGNLPAASAAPELRLEKVDADVNLDRSDRLIPDASGSDPHSPAEIVRAAIILEDAPTAGAGYATHAISSNADARSYDAQLLRTQQQMARTISEQALAGQKLDVVWNLTLVANMISANVPYGAIEAIRALEGVRDVVIERQYSPDTAEPNMHSATGMTGASRVWSTGYTGAGSRVAIVDTGTDTDHQSFDNGAYLYALEQLAREEGKTLAQYKASLDLLDIAEIEGVLDQLNVTERIGAEAAEYYLNEKLPFAANYVDRNLVVNHDHDGQGSHGSHVAGIAAANRFIPSDDGYADAMEQVFMNGVAPDAQIITLKVFGNADGPYDSDYFAAIEDAIWLGCDSVNLSLGSGDPGESSNDLFAELLDFLATTDTVVVMSAGNSGYWAGETYYSALYNDGVSFHTSGSPGTYTNSLSVASVDNDGTIGSYFTVDGRKTVYMDGDGYYNNPMAYLDTSADGSGTVYDYVFIDGLGYESDYAGIDVTGKVVFCSRGDSAFYEKATVAASLGAIATVIYNNTSGTIVMDLSDYYESAPCVMITQGDGKAIRAASEAAVTADGVTYFTGSMTVCDGVGASSYGSEYYTMSSFSSWGVPGSLEMKPEITAPGGLIWSVNGVDTSGSAYELMSGTSMAAPQVTGMAALVAEYIRDKGLEGKTDMSLRHLAQSLLMSTAEPLFEEASGSYYSILNQGAGLARVDRAVEAESYVLVEGMADGKVKVELGEDPNRTGVYEFSFTLNNLTGKAMTYNLRADLFTQDVFDGGGGLMFLDNRTRMLDAKAEFSVDGVSLEGMEGGFDCDLNGDGATNSKDADYLLEYLVGNVNTLYAGGDVNGDGKVNAYDAHLLLTKQSGSSSVKVPANGSVTVEVKLELTEDTRSFLENYYPTGAYIEGFVFAEPANGVAHAIPMLGYYGSWTEPGMFDVGSYLEFESGAESRPPYLYNEHNARTNYLTINYGDGDEYLFGGNPIVEEAEYLPRRNAFNNESGHMLMNLRYTLIRNAAETAVILRNADTGEIYLQQETGAEGGAYYYVNGGYWQNIQGRKGLGLDMAGIPEDTNLELCFAAVPELYLKDDGTVDYDALGEGAFLTTRFTIDNTAPQLESYFLTGNNLTVTAKDNQYVAAIALLNSTGTSILTAEAADQTAPNTSVTLDLNLNQVFGSKFLLAVFDYAENVTTYAVELELNNERPRFTAVDTSGDVHTYVGMGTSGSAIPIAEVTDRAGVSAAEFVDGWVFEISTDGRLSVGSDEDLFSFRDLGPLDPEGEWEIVLFNDLAYNTADGLLYTSFYSELNEMAVPYLCSIDPQTAQMTVLGALEQDLNSLAIDDEGNFYGITYAYNNCELYKFRADVISTGSYTRVGQLSRSLSTYQPYSLSWDHETDELFLARSYDDSGMLMEIDPATAKVTVLNTLTGHFVGLYIAGEERSGIFDPVEQVIGVRLPETASTIAGGTCQLSAVVLPWNVSDSSVSWSSSNSAVAAVDSTGLVTGVSGGTAVITAKSNLDPTKSASCTVTVSELDQTFKALIWDEEGLAWWSEFRPDTLPAYTKLSETADGLPLATTAVINGTLYAGTSDGSLTPSSLYIVDPETYELDLVGSSSVVCYTDMAWAPNVGYLIATYGGYLCLVDITTGEYIGAFSWDSDAGVNLVGITYAGAEYNAQYGCMMDYFLLLDENGNAYRECLYTLGEGYFRYTYGIEEGFLANIGKPVDVPCFQGFYFDGEYVYWTRLNTVEDVVDLLVWDVLGTGEVHNMGQFPEHVWPVGGLYTDAELTGSNALTAAWASNVPAGREMIQTVEPIPVPAAGGLNSVQPLSSGELDDAGTVTVTLTLPAAAPSGMMEVIYDTEKLELTGVQGITEAFAWAEQNGTVKLAFAEAEDLAAESAIARLTFAAVGMGQTSVIVKTQELGSEDCSLSQTINLDLPNTCTHAKSTLTGAVASTCTAEGYTGDRICANCGELLEEGSVIPATGHSWDEGVVTREPTEDTPGEMRHTCTVCGEIWIRSIPELGHEHSYEAVVTAPTCTERGYTTYTCSCGESYVDDYVDALGHNLGAWYTTREPDCTTEGKKQRSCSRCDHSEQRIVAALGHSFGQWTTVREPTGSKEGLEQRSCTRCGHIEERAIPVLENPFTDLKVGSYYYDAVLWAVHNGITNGVNSTTFDPKGECTRGQVVTFLWRAAGSPQPKQTEHPFVDVKAGKYYYTAMLWAVENNITKGTDATHFSPDKPCDRATVVTFLHRAMGSPAPTKTEHNFTDVKAGKYYYTAMLWAVENNITTGTTTTTFEPTKICNRATVVTFLYRTYAE